MATKSEVLLTGEFGIVKTKGLFCVTLTRGGILYFPVSNGEYRTKSFIQTGDIIGCRCNKASIDGKLQRFTLLTVFAYPFRKKIFSRKRTRFRFVISFEIRTDSFESSLKEGENWKNIILCLVRGIPVTRNDVYHAPPPMKQMMVLINPHSGPGKALQIFKNEVEPMMLEADVPYTVIITKYAGHARDLIHELDLEQWYSIVIVSGDGLIYEVINGLMSRPDWEKAIKMPVGCLPGGSGNALCCSINYSAGEPIDTDIVLHSAFVLLRHRVLPMDLVMIETPHQHLYSFLSLTWGIMADIDFESEKYRALGEARFTVGAIKRILNLRSYPGRISFLPVTEYQPSQDRHVKLKGLITKIRRFSLRSQMGSRTSMTSVSSVSDASMAPQSRGSSQSSHLSQGDTDQPRVTTVDVHCCDRSHLLEGEDGVQSEGDSQGKTVCLETLNETCSSDVDRDPRLVVRENGDDNSTNRNNCDFNLNYSCHPEGQSSDLVTDQGSMENLHNGLSGSKNFHSLEQADRLGEQLQKQNINNAHVMSGMGSPGSDLDHWRERTTRKRCGTLTATTPSGEVEIEEEVLVATTGKGAPVPKPLLRPLNEPVPEDWVVVEDNFILACAVYQTHLGSDMLAAPHAHLNDGFMYLFFVRDGIPRNALLNLFLSFGEGTHVDSPYVEFIRVLAFRLEPLTTSGNIMVDGERIDPCPLQGQILPGLARIMAIQ